MSLREHVKNGLATIVRGFLLGVGFSIAAGIAYFIAFQIAMSSMKETTSAYDVAASGGAAAKDLVLSGVEEQKHDNVTSIIGSVKNTGTKPARNVHLKANLFDHGKFVDEYSTYLSGSLAPGQSEYFKISCGCKDSPPAAHDSYKVEVSTGY